MNEKIMHDNDAETHRGRPLYGECGLKSEKSR